MDSFPAALNDVYNYFFATYLDVNCRFPPDMWHSLNIIDVDFPRTNNAIEGWHNTFANTFGTSKYSFYLLLSKLKDEEDAIRIKSFQQDELGICFIRKQRYINRENNIFEFLTETRNSNYGTDFVFEMSSVLNS